MTAMPRVVEGRRRVGLLQVFAATLAQAGAAAAGAFAIRALFGALHDAQALPLLAACVLAGSGFGIAAARVTAQIAEENMGQSYAFEIRQALLRHGTRATMSSVAARRQGHVSLRFVGDMTAFRHWAGRGVPRLLAAAVLIPATLALIGALHLPFLAAVAPVYAIALAIITAGGVALSARQRRLRSRRAALAADMAERMPVAPQLGALGRGRTERRSLERRAQKMIAAALSTTSLRAGLRAICDIATGLAALAVIVTGWHTDAGAATVAAGLAALGLAMAPMREIAGVWTYWSAFRLARSKAQAQLDRPAPRSCGPGRRLPRQPLSVSLSALSCGPLRNLCAEIPAGARVRLTGPNGAGKSRLLALLAGLETPEAGTVSLSDIPLRHIANGSLRRSVARISDDPVILRGSLRRALTLGLDTRPEDRKLRKTALACGLGGLLDRCGGLDGSVSEAGRTLSAGERTKIALVRAMLARPRLVLIDDALARLDADGRKALMRWLKRLRATVIATDAGAHPLPGCNSRLDLG